MAVQPLASQVGVAPACRALGVPRASFYRRQRPAPGHRQPRPTPARALRASERAHVLDVLASPRFVDRSPAEVVVTLLDEGRYLCAERTMYRILAANQPVRERRNQRSHPCYTKPELVATGPNQTWSWDITRLRGPKRWTSFYLYVLLDIFSRYVVGWMVADRENAALAATLIEETCLKQGIEPQLPPCHPFPEAQADGAAEPGLPRRPVPARRLADADLRAYFDTIPRDWLITFLEHRIGDRRVIRLIRKWLNAGVMDGGSWTDAGMGTPQGAVVSPVLANVFLHYVLDLWFDKKWRPNAPDGEAIIVRYADDIVVGFQHKRDAERYLRDVRERLARFGLSLHQDKTRLVEFGRFAVKNRRQRGVGKPETFDFLGFTHYCTTTRRGRFRLGRKPVAKRVNRTLARIDEVLRKRWHHDIWEVGKWLGRVCEGWLNYFAVPGSGRFIRAFHRRLQRLWMRALRRRSQRARFSWKRLERITEILWSRASIRHPWPDQRFAVNHPR